MNQAMPNGYQTYYQSAYLPAPPFVPGPTPRGMVLI